MLQISWSIVEIKLLCTVSSSTAVVKDIRIFVTYKLEHIFIVPVISIIFLY